MSIMKLADREDKKQAVVEKRENWMCRMDKIATTLTHLCIFTLSQRISIDYEI